MYLSSSWIGVAFGRRTMSSATVWLVSHRGADSEIAKPRIERIAQRRRWLRRSLEGKHALIPRLDGGRSACLRASAARSAAARTDAP
jgi:hypothetical protein